MAKRSVPAEKNFFSFNKGLITEASPLNFPEDSLLESENYELFKNGSLRRRRGLTEETGRTQYLNDTPSFDTATNTYKWRNAGTDPDVVFVVIQVGKYLYIYRDGEDFSENFETKIDLGGYGTRTANLVAQSPMDFTSGRGFLFVTGRYLEPLRIDYDRNADEQFTVFITDMHCRDFEGIDDGVEIDARPADGDPAHIYNLLNRGWIVGDPDRGLDKFVATQNNYPSKSMIPSYGFTAKPITTDQPAISTASWFDIGDTYKDWDSDKIAREVFGSGNAPEGSVIINPFDTTQVTVATGSQRSIVKSWSVKQWGENGLFPYAWIDVYFNLQPADSGRFEVGDTIDIRGTEFFYVRGGGKETEWATWDGRWPVMSVNGNTISVRCPGTVVHHYVNYIQQNEAKKYGTYGVTTYDNVNGITMDDRPSTCEFYLGRMFYAGITNRRWADGVFFSQVVTQDSQYGSCLQRKDPTHPVVNDLMDSDGGYIQLPGIGQTYTVREFGGRLLAFGQNGVWEIRGRSFFSARDIMVQKVSDVEALSSNGILSTDDAMIFTSTRGIYAITIDPRSGQLIFQSLSEDTIQGYWNQLSPLQCMAAKIEYDEVKKKVIILHSSDPDVPFRHDRIMFLDMRLSAYYLYTFNSSEDSFIMSCATTDLSTRTDEYKKIKYFVVIDGNRLGVADFSGDGYVDWDGTELVPYFITGYDNLGDFARHRSVPVLHCYSAPTETGWDGDEPINTSSTFVEVQWNFSTNKLSNKFSQAQQVYRRRRNYIKEPDETEFDDGYEVVVTRTKIRGKGKAVNIKFYGELGKDSHIFGWSLLYRGYSKI